MGQVADAIARAGQQSQVGMSQLAGSITAASESEVRNATLLEQQRRAEEERVLKQKALEQAAAQHSEEIGLKREELTATKEYHSGMVAAATEKNAIDRQQVENQNTQAANTLLITRQNMLLDHEEKQKKEVEEVNKAAGMDIVRQGTNLYSTYTDFMKGRKDAAVGEVTTARLPADEYARALDTHRKTLNSTYGSDVGEQRLKDEITTVNVLKSSVAMEIEGGTLHTRSLEQINTLFSNIRAQLPPTSPNIGYVDSLQVDTINQWKHMGGGSPKLSALGVGKAAREAGKNTFSLNKSAFSGGDPNAFKSGKITRSLASEQ